MSFAAITGRVRSRLLARAAFGLFGVALACACRSAQAKDWILENSRLRVNFSEQTGLFTATDRESGRTWRQLPAQDKYAVARVERAGSRLKVTLQGATDLWLTLDLASNSDLELSIQTDPNVKITAIHFPGPIETPAMDWNLVFPQSEGVLMPMREVRTALQVGRPYEIYAMPGLIMPWVGVTDANLQAGYMLIIDTPFDSAVRLADGSTGAAPEPLWRSEIGRFSYTRKLRYHFFSTGGYVAQAKHYREYVRRTAEFSTLRQRAKGRPQIDQLIGAVHIYMWGDGRDLGLARDLKAAGIAKAWIAWDPDHPPYPAEGYDQGIKALGYLSGVYDLYRDCYNDVEFDQKAARDETLRSLWLDRYRYPGLFQKIVARNADDSPREIRVSGDVGLMRYWTCTRAQLPFVPDRIGRELKTYPHNSIFLDVTLAAGPFECQSPEHPMTRREDAAARIRIHQIMADDYKMVVGSEWGADYGAAHTEFMHGVESLSQFWGPSAQNPSSPSYLGDWKNTVHPTMIFGEPKPTDLYWKYGLGPGYRVPLYELVYHDCTVASWRWDDNSQKEPEAWARKDLFNALYGTAPQWNLDRATWARQRDRFVASFRALSPVLSAVGYDEMIDHRFLTADRQVQATRFASGKEVVVNFGNQPRTVRSKLTIPGGAAVVLAGVPNPDSSH